MSGVQRYRATLPGWRLTSLRAGSSRSCSAHCSALLPWPSDAVLCVVAKILARGVSAAGAVGLLERPVVAPLARMVAQRSWGLIPRLPLGDAANAALCVVLSL